MVEGWRAASAAYSGSIQADTPGTTSTKHRYEWAEIKHEFVKTEI